MSSNDESSPAPAWLGLLLQVTDTAYPTGAFAHSGGLEGMMQLGQIRDLEGLARFLDRSVLLTLERCHLPLLRLSREAALDLDGAAIARLDEIAGALCPPEELRLASSRSGRQRLQLLARVMHLDKSHPREWEALVPRLRDAHLPVVAGIEAALLEIPEAPALQAFAYGTVSAILSASMKIMRIGQTPVQELLSRMMTLVPGVVERSRGIHLGTLGAFTPVADIASARHKRAGLRLFLS